MRLKGIVTKENEVRSLFNQRVYWVRREGDKKLSLRLDGLLSAVLSGAMPNISKRFEEAKTREECVDVILDYLMQTKDVSSSHFPTILQRKEAPNYHFSDYRFIPDVATKINILYWLLKFYYIELFRGKRRVVIGIRTEDREVEDIIRDFRRVGGKFDFELNRGKVNRVISDKEIVFFIPSSPSSMYFSLLSLLSALLQTLEYVYEDAGIFPNLDFEVLVLSNAGGKKWSTVYHPVINLTRIYSMFFKPEELTVSGKSKFIVFLESLLPPELKNQNIVDSHYALLSSLASSILLEGYLNVHKLSQVIGGKISLELRAERESHRYRLRNIYYLDYVHVKFFGGDSMSGGFERLRKQMKAVALSIGGLVNKGDTQRSLLKRILLDLKSEETPMTFVKKLISYLPRLEREGVKITLPQELISLPIREFFIIKNEFIVILWNKYIGGGNAE